MNFEKFTSRLYFLTISFFMLVEFQEDQNFITMSSIKCLNFKFS